VGNIKKSAVLEDVKNLMRSLVCVVHDDFDGTVQEIVEKGGKAGLGTLLIIYYYYR
jgi:hypothetical protein